MKRLSFEFIKNAFEKERYILISKEYINSKQKLSCLCPNKHISSIRFDDFKRNKRCGICFRNKLSRIKRLNFNYVFNEFYKGGYTLVTDYYKNCDQKLEYICLKGHTGYITFHNWHSGHRCPKCNYENMKIRMSGKGHPNWKGGISKALYCGVWRDKEYKMSIKIRDKNICQNPGCGNKNQLVLHHIDYDKKNCCPDNLITVCKSCNAKANFDREWYKSWYEMIIFKKHSRRN